MGKSTAIPIHWSDLQTKGYVVIPSWLSEEDLELLRQDYASQPLGANTNYPSRVVGSDISTRFQDKCAGVASQVSADTDLRVDMLGRLSYFSIEDGINLPWHQDHDSYFLFQNHYDLINLWVPIIKPVRHKSNMHLLPFDRLEEVSAEVFGRLCRGGATHVFSHQGHWFLQDDVVGQTEPLPFDPHDIAVAPDVGAGDALVLRGDMLHKTQDTETRRVAISFRMVNSAWRVTPSALVTGPIRQTHPRFGLLRFIHMVNNARTFQSALEVYEQAQRDELTLAEFQPAFFSHMGQSKSQDVTNQRFRRLLARAVAGHEASCRLSLELLRSQLSDLEAALPRVIARHPQRGEAVAALGRFLATCPGTIDELLRQKPAPDPLEAWFLALETALQALPRHWDW